MSKAKMQNTSTVKRWRKALPFWVQALIIVVVFGCGVGVGGMGATRYMLSRMQHLRANPNEVPRQITESLSSRLSLTDEQADQILDVITHRHAKIEAIRATSAPEIHAEFDKLESEVTACLTEQQQTRWHGTTDWVRKTFLPIKVSE